MKSVRVTIRGISPLLMNRFTDEEAEKIEKGTSSAATARSKGEPRDRAARKLYADEWQVSFCINFDPDVFHENLVRELVDIAGQRIGIGDFRPARKGPFGRFKVASWQSEKAAEQAA